MIHIFYLASAISTWSQPEAPIWSISTTIGSSCIGNVFYLLQVVREGELELRETALDTNDS